MKRARLGWVVVCVGAWLVSAIDVAAGAAPKRPASRPLPPSAMKQRPPVTPNIILIVTDDLGYGDLGSYGQKLIRTPNLDRLAAEGMRFTQCYAGSPVGNASRATLMTGKHTGHATIRGNANGKQVPLKRGDITLPQVLRAAPARYRTIGIGKWNLGANESEGAPFKKGFDHWVGFKDQLHANNYYPKFLWRYEPGIRGVNRYHGPVEIYRNTRGGGPREYATDLLTKAAINAMRVHRPAFDNGFRPFFIYLSYTAPHANNELFKSTKNGMQVPHNRPYDIQQWPLPEKNKAAMISLLDHNIGQLMAKIKELGMEKETVLIFTSDNGPHAEGGVNPAHFKSAGPFRGMKRTLYEGGLRVPFIVKWLGKVRPNTVNHELTALWDLLPTLSRVARTAPPRQIDGLSMLTSWIGLQQKERHDFLYWEFHEGGSKQAARSGNWKVIRPAPGKALELYDLGTDVAESRNIAAQHPQVIARFENFLRTARTRSLNWPITMPGQRSAATPR